MTRSLQCCSPRNVTVFDDLRSEMDRLVDGIFRSEGETRYFAPAANLAETEDGYEVTVDLPGMKADDLEIELKDGHLWITGSRGEEKTEEGKTFHRVERRSGTFRRVIALGGDVDGDKVEATYNDGVLAVTVPKAEAAKPKKIVVKA